MSKSFEALFIVFKSLYKLRGQTVFYPMAFLGEEGHAFVVIYRPWMRLN